MHPHCGASLPGADLDSIADLMHDPKDRKSTRLNSSHGYISYAVFCLKKKNKYSSGHRGMSTSSMSSYQPPFSSRQPHVSSLFLSLDRLTRPRTYTVESLRSQALYVSG